MKKTILLLSLLIIIVLSLGVSGLINNTHPLVGYVVEAGDENTGPQHVINNLTNNNIKNYSVIRIDARWANLTDYEDLVDVFYIGGRFAPSTPNENFNIRRLNQTRKGIFQNEDDYIVPMGWCNTLVSYTSSKVVNFVNNTMPVFNSTNGVVIGNNEIYDSFKEFFGCNDSDTNIPIGRFAANSTEGIVSFATAENQTVFNNGNWSWTTQSRWIEFGAEDDEQRTGPWTELTHNLSILALNWILDLQEVSVGDTTLPTFTNFENNASATQTGTTTTVNFSIILADNVQLDVYRFAHNQTGTLTNGTDVTISGTSFPVSELLTVTLSNDNVICGQFWFNDTSGNINNTNLSCFTVESSIPTYTNFQNNASVTQTGTGSTVNFSITLADNVQLNLYRFAHNQSGTLTNGSDVLISGTSLPVSEELAITLEAGENICGQFWFNDTSN